LFPPKQETSVEAVTEAEGEPALGTFTVAVAEHALASVTVTVYTPESSPGAAAPVPPEGAHE
jgi:hypothetical protein